MTISTYLFRNLLSPRSQHPDARRQEFIFNIIVVALLVAALLASAVATINAISDSADHYAGTFTITWVFTLFLAGLLLVSRVGRARLAILIFMSLLALITIQLVIKWGFMLPTGLLLMAMIVVIAGVLLGARSGLWFSLAAATFLLTAGYLQEQGTIHADTSWLNDKFHVGDAIGYVLVLTIIGIVSWLSNREIDRSLQRARASEKVLALERDNLEVKVAARTRELEETQLVRLMELQRFATFGHLSANLLHEIANPLTAVSLNLELMDPAQSAMVKQARNNVKHLERYVQAARQQLRGTSQVKNFSVNNEIKQLLRLLGPRAARTQVVIDYQPVAPYRLFGDPVRFSQLLGNLVANAIDAYAGVGASNKVVTVTISRAGNKLICSVHDAGVGLSAEQQRRMFEPFYTTKQSDGRSLGIGLAMVQQFVEQDFRGTITVSSSKAEGTNFQVALRQQHHAKG